MQETVDSLSAAAFLTYSFALVSHLLPPSKSGRSGFLARLALAAGCSIHLAALVLRSIYVGHAPMANLYETLLFFSFCTALSALVYSIKYENRVTGIICLPVSLALLFFAIKADHKFTPLFLALKTLWFEIHVMASFAGYALFTVAFASAIFFLYFRRKGDPMARICEEMTNSANVWGFGLFSTAMFSGAIWAYLAWGNYWFWEPKTIWSFILWFYFAGIVHGHYLKGWRGPRVAWMTVAGFAVVIFTYVGVGLLMKSSHNL